MSETDFCALKQDEPETPEQMETRRSELLEAVCNFLGDQGYELDSLDETAELLGWLIEPFETVTGDRNELVGVIARALRPDGFWNETAEYPTKPRSDWEKGQALAHIEAGPIADAVITHLAALANNTTNNTKETTMQITDEQLKGLEESFAEELAMGGDASMMAATARIFFEELAGRLEAELPEVKATRQLHELCATTGMDIEAALTLADVYRRWNDALAERDAALATMKQAARVEDNHRDKDFMWIVGQMRGILEASPLWKANK